MLIRQKRIDKGWSQSQLAEFSGLSLRTIQRIEKGQKPTVESLKALASVFETDIATLSESDIIDESILSEDEVIALKQVRRMKRFFIDLLVYFTIVPLICVANWLLDPEKIWGGLTALGWGIWLVIEAFNVFEASHLFSGNWEKRQLEKRLGRKIK